MKFVRSVHSERLSLLIGRRQFVWMKLSQVKKFYYRRTNSRHCRFMGMMKLNMWRSTLFYVALLICFGSSTQDKRSESESELAHGKKNRLP